MIVQATVKRLLNLKFNKTKRDNSEIMNILKLNEWMQVNKPEYVTTTTDDTRTNKQKGRYYVYELNGRPIANGKIKEREFFVFDHETNNAEVNRYGELVAVFNTMDELVKFGEEQGCVFADNHKLDFCFSDVFEDDLIKQFGVDKCGYPNHTWTFKDDNDKEINFIL